MLDSSVPKHKKPVPEKLLKMMKQKGMSVGSPLLLRIYKEENTLEVWKQDHRNKFALLTSYEICKWSGKPGPKLKEGDRQAPEGFYHVTPGLMNPNSSYHLSFNMGYPNAYDRANDRTGSFLMIHGACSSAGCYSMTDEYVEEIYALAREAFSGGQKAFQIQAFPFRMTPENMAKNVNSTNFAYWSMLKEGADYFEVTKKAPKVDVCEKRYVFNRNVDEGERFSSVNECPPTNMPRSLATAFTIRQDKDQEKFDRILKQLRASPFVKPEDKPLTVVASIKAKPTIGPLTLTDPQPVAPPTPPETQDVETNNDEAAPQGQQQDPFSAEVTSPVVSNNASGQSANIPQSATAEPAQLPAPSVVPQKRPQLNTAS